MFVNFKRELHIPIFGYTLTKIPSDLHNMNNTPTRAITADESAQYDHDGVILLKGIFDQDWIDPLNKGLTENCENPTHRSRVWDRDAEGRTMFWDSQARQNNAAYRDFVFNSPAAQIAGELMQATTINFFFDAVFVRSAGSQFATPWHQDEPYWLVEGYNTCTIWMPLVPVAARNALAFVPGSHKSNAVFDQYNFGELNPDSKTDVDQVDFKGVAEESIPDIDADSSLYGDVSWDMEPGDCVVFNSRIMHGGSGRLDDDRDLKVFMTKWLGDDVHIRFRECGMDPDHSEIMSRYRLKPGDRPGTDLYPLVWSQI
jgi:ectoine hydroxylase-related dioxygenase (phytanoyl-CoA dioxygenase family)